MTNAIKKWGYKPDGSACVFLCHPGDALPLGWHDNHSVIENEELRHGEALSKAAGDSIQFPVAIGDASEAELYPDDGPGEPRLAYDENNRPVVAIEPPVVKRRGRPPKIRME